MNLQTRGAFYKNELYTLLLNLVNEGDQFYFKDYTRTDDAGQERIYRVFNYRLASYSDFLKPGARSARGIMFEIDHEGKMLKLACRMPHKFFNLNENPITSNLDLSDSNIDIIMPKLDGSIISTFEENGNLLLKSKTSLTSEHAQLATKCLDQRPELKQALLDLVLNDMSVHMELTSPVLRIVIGYQTSELTILSINLNNKTFGSSTAAASIKIVVVEDIQKTRYETVSDQYT